MYSFLHVKIVIFYFRKEVWYMLEQFSERIGKIDKVHFMTKPVVHKITKHFKYIREATAR